MIDQHDIHKTTKTVYTKRKKFHRLLLTDTN